MPFRVYLHEFSLRIVVSMTIIWQENMGYTTNIGNTLNPFVRSSLLSWLIFLCCVAGGFVNGLPLAAQDRDLRGERVVIDDNGGNLITIQTAAGPITGGTLLVPDPGGSASILISDPLGGSQSVAGNVLLINSGTASELRLFEPSGSGSNYSALKAQAQAANVTYTLPAEDGSSGQVLRTDGSGMLSWVAPGVGVGEAFITATASGTLTSERTLSGGTGVTLSDGGANSTMTVAIGQDVAPSAVPQFAGLVIPAGNISVTTGNLSITTGNISTTIGNITTASGIVSGSTLSDGTASLTGGTLSNLSSAVGPAAGNLFITSNGSLVMNLDEDNSGSGSSFAIETNGAGADLFKVTETGLTDIVSSSTNGTLRLENSLTNGKALQVISGRMIGSESSADQSGGTVPGNLMIARVADDGVGASQPGVTLPISVNDGQFLFLVVEDPDGVNITNALKAGVDPTADGLYTLIYYNDGVTSGWAISR